MTINKIYKAITLTTIISLNLATASSSVKAATLTLTSQSEEIQINNDLTIEELDSDVLSVSNNNPGVLIINISNLTSRSINLNPSGSSISLNPSGGNISLNPSGGSISLNPSGGTTGGTISITTEVLKIRTTSAQAIPEPTSLTSFAILGLGGLLLRLKKNNPKKRG